MTFIPAFDAAHKVMKDNLPAVAAGEPYTARGIAAAVNHLDIVDPTALASLQAARMSAMALDFNNFRNPDLSVDYEAALHAALDILLTFGLATERIVAAKPDTN